MVALHNHNHKCFCFVFCLIWFFTSQSTIFQFCPDGSSLAEPALSMDKCVLLKNTTQWHLMAPVLRKALYHWATMLHYHKCEGGIENSWRLTSQGLPSEGDKWWSLCTHHKQDFLWHGSHLCLIQVPVYNYTIVTWFTFMSDPGPCIQLYHCDMVHIYVWSRSLYTIIPLWHGSHLCLIHGHVYSYTIVTWFTFLSDPGPCI